MRVLLLPSHWFFSLLSLVELGVLDTMQRENSIFFAHSAARRQTTVANASETPMIRRRCHQTRQAIRSVFRSVEKKRWHISHRELMAPRAQTTFSLYRNQSELSDASTVHGNSSNGGFFFWLKQCQEIALQKNVPLKLGRNRSLWITDRCVSREHGKHTLTNLWLLFFAT